MKKYLSTASLLTCIVLAAGCGSVQRLDLAQGLKEVRKQQRGVLAGGTSSRPVSRDIYLVVAAPQRLVAAGRFGREGEGFREVYPFAVPDADGAPPPIKDSENVQQTRVTMILNNVSSALSSILKRRFQKHFQRVRVARLKEGTAAPVGAVVVEPRLEIRWPAFGVIVARATMRASRDQQVLAEVTVESEPRRPTKHLPWMLPLAIATFPVGTIVMVAIGSSIKGDYYQESLAEALDRGATQLALQLAQRVGHGRDTHTLQLPSWAVKKGERR